MVIVTRGLLMGYGEIESSGKEYQIYSRAVYRNIYSQIKINSHCIHR